MKQVWCTFCEASLLKQIYNWKYTSKAGAGVNFIQISKLVLHGGQKFSATKI